MSKKNRKMIDKIRRNQKILDMRKYNNYCECNHRDANGFALIPTGRKDKNGVSIYKCRDCEAEILIKRYSPDEIALAKQTICTMCDTVKMNARPDDEKVIQRAQRMQASLVALERDYNAVLNHNDNNRNREQSKRNRRETSTYGGAIQSFSGRR